MNLSRPAVEKMACARLPIEEGQFTLCLYRNNVDGKDHLTFTLGDIGDQEGVLTRLHSECFTGDVLGSLRCDCGPQLRQALGMIGKAGRGVLIYLRQEGRGIGLLDKLRAYNLQDVGYDTVDANLELGHQADAREYTTAALILKDLGVRSVDLITNNPLKIQGLTDQGVPVSRRIPLETAPSSESVDYINTKIKRMNHMLPFIHGLPSSGGSPMTDPPSDQIVRLPLTAADELENWLNQQPIPMGRPLVTLAFAQSLDGSIAMEPNKPLLLSGPESQLLTHRLRRWHQGILIGIGTLVSDNPLLTVRLVAGDNPQPIVVDPTLRFPLQARLLSNPRKPWVAAAPACNPAHREALLEAGAQVLEVPGCGEGKLDLKALLQQLRARGIERVMVEGGARILRAFLREQLADTAVVTIAPRWVGGLSPTSPNGDSLPFPSLSSATWRPVGQDMVLWSTLDWK